MRHDWRTGEGEGNRFEGKWKKVGYRGGWRVACGSVGWGIRVDVIFVVVGFFLREVEWLSRGWVAPWRCWLTAGRFEKRLG